ncbi:MAG: hypothetical protein A2750_01920 [Candidatus Yanofskybacteria bacterium RIFCSPHIGHO2_01_FULL_45_42]|uniref:Uncharacterized protein n=3 Tax=Candidatus Yanofskyibacteriota TaxID=1752733 RepID=A0A1F8H3Q8_9BACT|nr:MAG: hypothetical protein A2750_01920 [Candidatus Yanofskybacteria bacterium RIFCSPHIGHO2_01_FULL_45_42]OGN15571.1 MAG: hypothetical protein A3C81_00305 [Candidatus Yanofskybacteria bacterium RIFCSPHIGHO2_02_FULL_46_19]OGN27895.1 MAG: hypothetical protein A3B17_01820 [Candidatus Yanofskybacteria bacterium RIFCSPLOWO2_01_FULL_45_72]OGN32207.1 MAG: hypothetical protein A3J01_01295 [Candidatus Yanofskybacteria bacterium RIFCSPLOWO2_02_FULL_45_18]
MDFDKITGAIAMIISLGISLLLADQIRLVRKIGRTENLSIPLQVIVTLSYLGWVLHGLSTGDLFLTISQSFGFIMMCMLLYSIERARKKDK